MQQQELSTLWVLNVTDTLESIIYSLDKPVTVCVTSQQLEGPANSSQCQHIKKQNLRHIIQG